MSIDTVIHGDCLQVMRGLEANSIDAVITDPPYCSGGISEASRMGAKGQGLRSENIRADGWFTGDNMGTAGLSFLLREVALESLRLLKASGSLLVFCDWRMVTNLVPVVESAGFRYQNLIVWDKGSGGLGTGFRPRHELIMHMTCGAPAYHDLCATNVLKASRVSPGKREHQTQKPADLIAQLIRVVCPPGGVVLDPFAGSGTLAEAAGMMGRHYICIERDGDHCETAKRRAGTVQPDLLEAAN